MDYSDTEIENAIEFAFNPDNFASQSDEDCVYVFEELPDYTFNSPTEIEDYPTLYQQLMSSTGDNPTSEMPVTTSDSPMSPESPTPESESSASNFPESPTPESDSSSSNSSSVNIPTNPPLITDPLPRNTPTHVQIFLWSIDGYSRHIKPACAVKPYSGH